MKEVVGGNVDQNHSFRETLYHGGTGFFMGGFASLAFTIASGNPLAIGASVASIALGVVPISLTEHTIKDSGYSSKYKGTFFTPFLAPFIVAAGLMVNTMTDNQETIIDQNNRILEKIQIPTP